MATMLARSACSVRLDRAAGATRACETSSPGLCCSRCVRSVPAPRPLQQHVALAEGTLVRPGGLSSSSQRSRRIGRGAVVRASADGDEQVKKSTEFGYSRKDIILLGAGLIAFGYALYYGLQAAGVEAGTAGNAVQLIVFFGICIGYVSTYIFRVANKDMTYVKQLEDYEEAVMAKRLAEMPPEDLERLLTEVEEESAERAEKKRRLLQAAQQAQKE